jgi:hypothetical protein
VVDRYVIIYASIPHFLPVRQQFHKGSLLND